MSSIFLWIYVIAAVVLLFGAAVFVHEWGHYFMALKRKLKVEAFAIGFGPKIFGWKKNGIDYSWRWIPAGGFVRIPQMITSEALEGKDDKEPLPPADPISKILVAFAGPFMNIVFAFVIASVLYFTGLPVLIDPSVIGYVDPASAEGKMGIQEGDRIVQVNGKPTKSWQDVQEATVFSTINPVPVVIERNGVRNEYKLEAKPSPFLGGKYLSLESKEPPVIGQVLDGPAKEAGIQTKDLVLEFAGVKIAGIKQFTTLVNERAGKPTEIVVRRGDQRMALNVTPRGPEGQGKIRVGFESGKNYYEVQKPGPLPWVAIDNIVDKTFATLNAVFFRSKETGVGPSDLSGPIGIFAMLAHQVTVDYRLALSFLLLLNVNLAILNLLPLPVLDGGHIVMSIIEKIIRRPLPVKIQEYATTAFAVVLISFMLFVSFHDVKRIGLFKSLFDQ
ncbi:MAG: RIP metalloprotease RseP, partial [Limisphaerales bacterium]